MFISTDHHLVYNGVTAEDVVFPGVLLDMVLHPRGLSWAWQADHHDDLHNKKGKEWITVAQYRHLNPELYSYEHEEL